MTTGLLTGDSYPVMGKQTDRIESIHTQDPYTIHGIGFHKTADLIQSVRNETLPLT